MRYRMLGKTGLRVSAVGLGMWAMGGDSYGPIDDAASLDALNHAWNLGVNFFDTADIYGNGHSEEVLGRWLKTVPRGDVYIATKCGLRSTHSRRARQLLARVVRKAVQRIDQHKPIPLRSVAGIIADCEASLRRLGTDWIDVYQDHLWWDEDVEVFAEAFHRLRSSGKIRFVGLSTNDNSYIRKFDALCKGMDTLQIDYSLLNRKPEQEVFPYCRERGIGVIARGPLAMGKLTGKFNANTTFPPTDGRRSWLEAGRHTAFLSDLERIQQLQPLANGRTLAQAAIAYVLHDPVVSVAIPGAKTREQVEENVRAADHGIDADALVLIDRICPLSAAKLSHP
jgi:aryl-alcohol dehydrogenase-like predicted oxidoreductase